MTATSEVTRPLREAAGVEVVGGEDKAKHSTLRALRFEGKLSNLNDFPLESFFFSS